MRHHYAAHSTGCDLPPLLNSEGNITIPSAECNVVECPRLRISDLIAESEGPSFISSTVTQRRLDRRYS